MSFDIAKYPTLALVDSTQELRLLPKESLPKLCDELRRYLLDSVSRSSGHFASGLGTVEPVSYTHLIRCWLLCGNTTSQLKRCYGTFFLSIRIISLSKYLLKNPHVYPIRLPLYTSREFKTEVVMNDYKMTPGERRATWGLGTVFSLRMLGDVYKRQGLFCFLSCCISWATHSP